MKAMLFAQEVEEQPRQPRPAEQRRRSGGGKAKPSVYLWNPLTTMFLSLVLTPLFGSLVQMLNWRILQEEKLAQQSLWWFVAGCVILLGNQFFSALLPEAKVVDTFTVSLLVLYVTGWFLLAGRRQVRYVREHFPRGYGHRPWLLVLVIALSGCVAYMLLGVALTVVMDLLR